MDMEVIECISDQKPGVRHQKRTDLVNLSLYGGQR
jgi:hypothetical protein